MLARVDGSYRDAIASLRVAHPSLPEANGEDTVRTFCTDEAIASAFKREHPTTLY